jgi:hypothetical protein
VIKRAHERGDSGAPPDGADAWRRDNNVPLSGNEQVSLSSVGVNSQRGLDLRSVTTGAIVTPHTVT